MSNGHIFISYRRDDSAGYTRAIYDQLVRRFGKGRIFMDVDAIEPGLPFDEVINQAVGRCEVLLVMIGKRWLERQPDGRARIDDENDFVRLEVAAALSRDTRVIPVLLDGAAMPSEEVLPVPLRALARRNAIEVGNSRFDSDVERLVEAIGKVLGEAPRPQGQQAPRSRRSMLYWLLGGSAAVAMVPVVRLVMPPKAAEATRSGSAQGDWRSCKKCRTLFYDGYPGKGVCPAGGAHDAAGLDFVLPHDVAGPGQPDWRFCTKCQSMFYDGYPTKGVCAAGGAHNAAGFNFVLTHDVPGPGQADWRFCEKCQSMFYDGDPAKGVCPAGGAHKAAGFNFVLAHE